MMIGTYNENINIYNLMVFILGLTSTFQLIQIAGVNIFSLMAAFIVIISLLLKKKISFDNRAIIFYLCIVVSQFGNVFISKSYIYNAIDWKVQAFKSFFIFTLIFFCYGFIKTSSQETISFLLRGIYVSCTIQVIWCYCQFITYILCYCDLNELFFANILHMADIGMAVYRNGSMVLSGINTNAGALPGILLFVFLSNENNYILKYATLLLFFITGNSTTIICGFLLLIFSFARCINIDNGVKINPSKLYGIIICMFIICAIGCIPAINSRVITMIYSLIKRIGTVFNHNWSDGSTFVHFRYYQSIPYILSNIGLLRMIFGFGFRCGGIPFVVYFNQYPDTIYSTESDPISLLYSFGILGVFAFYCFLAKIIKEARVVDKKYKYFIIILMITGIFYGQQFNWVIFLELLILVAIEKKIPMSNVIFKKVSKKV